MERYDYLEAVKDDVREYIAYAIDLAEWRGKLDDLAERLNDELWISDSVTGNGSGSYTFNTWRAEEYLCHNLDLLAEAYRELGGDAAELLESPESADVTIRCYLLPRAVCEVIDELEDEEDEEEENA